MKCSSKLWTPVLAVFIAGGVPLAASGADPTAKKAAKDAASATKPPMVVHNNDGTFTIQKNSGEATSAKAKKGLVIPPQVVVPIFCRPVSKNASSK
ncbi:MAG TPA: hypothetical protein VG675_15820 [Bryobacteraceae bacterium]|nr:hypothetical protein [Bryobacteraceae bacterium]